MSIGRRVRAYTRLLEAAKALTTRDYVRGISRLSALFNTILSNSTSLTIPIALPYNKITANIDLRSILDNTTKRIRKLTLKKAKSTSTRKSTLATAITLYNYNLPIKVALAFATAILTLLTIYINNPLLPKLANSK
jgi:hypothetical protein